MSTDGQEFARLFRLAFPIDYDKVAAQGRLVRTRKFPQKDQKVVLAWSGLVVRAIKELYKDKKVAGLTELPFMPCIILKDDLCPEGWDRLDMEVELFACTGVSVDTIKRVLDRLAIKMVRANSQALEPFGWLMPLNEGQGWLAFVGKSSLS